MTDERKFRLKVSEDDDDVAYLSMPSDRGGLVQVSRSIRLVDLIGPYSGPDVVLDFDAGGCLVGIELLN